MRPDSITLAIFEKYSPAELAETAQNLAQAWADKETAEAEKKSSDAVFKERINTHESKVAELATKYNKGGETAQVGCTIRYDRPKPGQKSYIRMDTEEIVEVHDMNLEERQETIQFPLTASEEAKPEKKTKGKKPSTPEEPPAPIEVQTSELTFKDCPYPACILFAEHEGAHEFPKGEEVKADTSPEPQPEVERKTKRKKRDFAPPPEPPCQEPPADSPLGD